jgi:phosphate-selective porin OprO/OprP
LGATVLAIAAISALTLLPSAPSHAGDEQPKEPPAPASPPEKPAPTVESRLEKLEETNAELLELVRALQGQNQELTRRLERIAQQEPRTPAPTTPPLDRSLEGGEDSTENPVQVGGAGPTPAQRGATGGGSTPFDRSLEGGQDSIENPVQASRGTWKNGNVLIGPGFMLETDDEEFQLQFHSQIQAESRVYQQGGMVPAAGGFDIPRARAIFNGRLTKALEYDLSIEAAYGTINLLNAFLNFKASEQFMVKVGRYKVPFLYEYFAISNVDLINPERSLFGINYGFNRMPGAQVWGQLLEKRLDYAVGIFNGPRNQYLDFNNSKDLIAYMNLHPFEGKGMPGWLHHLNFGGSVNTGSQDNPVVPRGLKTSVSQSTNVLLDNVAPNWLVFNPDVRERGWRTLWALHAAYFYKQLSLYGEWQTGYTKYGRSGEDHNTQVSVAGWYVAAGYFLTGEEVTRRTQIDPKHDFSLKPGNFGLGALELVGRYSTLSLGDNVFTAGLADQTDWSNSAYATDIGFNWYLNPYIKIYLDWQHSAFGKPVLFAPDRYQLTSDLYWLRFQLYF